MEIKKWEEIQKISFAIFRESLYLPSTLNEADSMTSDFIKNGSATFSCIAIHSHKVQEWHTTLFFYTGLDQYRILFTIRGSDRYYLVDPKGTRLWTCDRLKLWSLTHEKNIPNSILNIVSPISLFKDNV